MLKVSPRTVMRFIATEFIEGQTLCERLQCGLEIDEALEIAIQVASALVAAHRVNIIHRDIKPENWCGRLHIQSTPSGKLFSTSSRTSK